MTIVQMVDIRPTLHQHGQLNGWHFACLAGEWTLVPLAVASALEALGQEFEKR